MDIIKYLSKLKFKLFNRSKVQPRKTLESPPVKPITIPKYASHIGEDIDDTIEKLIALNRKLYDNVNVEPIKLIRKSTLEWWLCDDPDEYAFKSQVHLLKELLEDAMLSIDTPGDGTYYRRNKMALDDIYPKLLDELKFVRLIESSSK